MAEESEFTEPKKEKKKRVRKPPPTPVEGALKALAGLSLGDKLEVYTFLTGQLQDAKQELSDQLLKLGGI